MRTAIYLRVSVATSKGQTLIGREILIEKQLDRLREYAALQGEAPAEEDIFLDDGQAGGTLDRTALNHLRDGVSRRLYNRVLVTSADRLARDHTALGTLIEEFERGGCHVEYIT